MRKILTLSIFVFLTGFVWAKPNHLILISIDGLKPEYLLEREKLNLKIPNLERLMREGSYTLGAESVFPSVTYPAHTTILTGVRPAQHGIVGNKTFDPLGLNQDGWYWYCEAIRVKTLWQAAKEKGDTVGNVFWPVTVGADIDFNIPEYWRSRTPEDIHLVRALSSPPGLVKEIEKSFGGIASALYESQPVEGLTDRLRANALVHLIVKHRPNFVLGHFTDVDEAQHVHGPYSAEAFKTLETIDSFVGDIVNAAKIAGIGEECVFAVVSDHGFVKTEKSLRVNSILKNAGLITMKDDGKVADWKALAQVNGPTAAIMLKDRQDGEVLKKTEAVLRAAARDPANGIAKIYTKKEMAKYGGYPDAEWVLETKLGYVFSSSIKEPLIVPSSSKGFHGHSPDMPQMKASFVIAGKDVRKGAVVKKMRLIDVAPTLAALMGWDMPGVEGKVITAFINSHEEARASR